MPNWVESNLKITGKKEELQRFKEFALTKENILDTDKFIPYPKKFKEQDRLSKLFYELKEKKEKGTLTNKEMKELVLMSLNPKEYEKDGFNSGGHSWCVNNYGTKWGICHSELSEENEKELFYSFDTAWADCSPVILKMSELFPKLRFNYKYWEGGSGFRGILICKKGVVIKANTYDYKGYRGG